MELVVKNNFTQVRGRDRFKLHLIKSVLTYKTTSLRRGQGFVTEQHKLLFIKPDLGLCFPSGLLHDVLLSFRNKGEQLPQVIDNRIPPSRRETFPWTGRFELRDYQQDAVLSVTKPRGVETGRTIIQLPVRSGKTVIAAGLTSALELPTIYLVHSKLALAQAADTFRQAFGAGLVSVHGGGDRDIGKITIATVQSLHRSARLARKLSEFDLLMVDECHHLVAPRIREAVINSNCYYKVGFSATPYVSIRSESEQSAIWLKAATGPIRFRMSHGELAELGHVLMPKIFVVNVAVSKGLSGDFMERITGDVNRNLEVVRAMAGFAKARKPAAVITSRLGHMRELCEYAARVGVRAKAIHGGTGLDDRRRYLAKLSSGELDCVVGTVINEAVDIPKLEGVVIAEGLKSRIRAIQRLRNLTASKGKGEPVVIDFFDRDGSILERHSHRRIAAYEKAGFKVDLKKNVSEIFERGYNSQP